MSTALDIIKSALKNINVIASGETPDSESSADALRAMNLMIDQWNNEKMMSYYTVDDTFTLTANVGQYTIGSGQTLNTTRPLWINTAWVRDSTSGVDYDYSLEIISDKQYQTITQKDITSTYPKWLRYEAIFPYGEIYIWPVPTAALTLGLQQTTQLSNFASVSTTVTLPPGYESALVFNLAVELSPQYGKVPSNIVTMNASKYKANIKRLNHEEPYGHIDKMVQGGGRYNIYTDSNY